MVAILPAASAGAQGTSERAIQAAVFVDRAAVAYGEAKYQEALKELEEALRLDPESVDALYYLGLVYTALDRPEDARSALEKARKIRPKDVDVAFQLATLHFSQKEYDKAEPLLREVYRADPKRPNVGYYLGIVEFNKQNFRAALNYFKANVPSDDNFAQLNGFYMGVTLARLGALGEAKAEIDQAIRLQPASPLTAPAQRFGEILEKSVAADKRFRGELRLGVYYDTNVPVVPKPGNEVAAQSFRSVQNRRKSEGELATLDLAYIWLRMADWEGAVAHRFIQTYNNHLTEYNTQSNTPSLSILRRGVLPGALGNLPYTAGAQFAYDYISLGNRPFTQRWILTPYISLSENEANVTTLQVRYQAKDFFHDKDFVSREIRDADNYMVGGTHFLLLEKGRHYAKLGYQFDAECAEGRNWSYRGHRLLTGFQFTLPWDVRFRYDLDLHWRFYTDRTILPPPSGVLARRRDVQPVHLTGIAKDFLQNFTVALEYLYDREKSNVDLYDYRRHVITTSVAWRF